MKAKVLIAAAPLALAACNFGFTGGNLSGGNTVTANAAAPGTVPDSVTINGVTYVREGAGSDRIAPGSAATPSADSTPIPASTTMPPPISDSGAPVPPNTGEGGTAADHGD